MLLVTIIGVALLALGGFIACLNFYLSFIRYPLHRRRGGTREDFRWVSGFPLFGTFFLFLAVLMLAHVRVLMWTAIGLSLLDTGGQHWFIVTMIYMALFRRRSDGASS
jgi:hypothetical protein